MTELQKAAVELQALAALIERPPVDDVLLTEAVALRSAAAIKVVLTALVPTATESDAVAFVRQVADMVGDELDAHASPELRDAARAVIAAAPAGDEVKAGKVLDDIVQLSIVSAWDEGERRSIIRAMEEYAALTRPRAAVGEREACKECGGSSLFWFVHYHNRSQVVEGRLRTGDVECLFVLGCEECSATQRTVTADKVAAILALQSSPAKVETQS